MIRRGQTTPKWMFPFLALAFITASSMGAQNAPDKRRAFEVASVKLSDPNLQNYAIGTAPGGRFMASNCNWTLKRLMGMGVQGTRSSPGHLGLVPISLISLRKQRKAEGTISDDRPASSDELPPTRYLVQTLLAERFNLKLHREMRDLTVFELVIAKNGPKLQKAVAVATGPPEIGVRHIYASSITVKTFCAALGLALQRAIRDKTGLDGTFQVHLEWSGNLNDTRDPAATSAADGGASIFTAIEEQLGLRLESRKTAASVIVVDSADKPLPD